MVDKGNHPQMALIQVLGVRKRSGVALIQVSEIWFFYPDAKQGSSLQRVETAK